MTYSKNSTFVSRTRRNPRATIPNSSRAFQLSLLHYRNPLSQSLQDRKRYFHLRTMSQPKPIVLWCHPRSVSSALERAFMQRPDFKCLHEPYGDPFHFNLSERLSNRYTDEEIRSEHADKMGIQYADVTRELLGSPGDGKRIFSKDMAQYIVSPDKEEVIVTLENLRKMNHIFLIRSPKLSCPSYYRCCMGDAIKETNFKDYDPKEAGYRELRILFDYIRKHGINGTNSMILIDAETLTANPEGTLKRVCEELGVDWDPKMLSW